MRSRLIRRVVVIVSLLFCTITAGTLGFRVLEGYTWFEAFYRTLTTITTVGDPQAAALSHMGRVFNALLILFGVSAMFLAVGAMTQTIIELELQDRYGERRRRHMIAKLQDHFIVCGYGRVGRHASREFLNAGAPCLVLDRREERVVKAREAGMVAVIADATEDSSLRDAGVLRARGLIAALPSDAENLFVILSAKALNPKLLVATRASEEEAGEKLRHAGADTVFTPYAMAGRQLANVLLRPHVVEFVDYARSHIGPGITMEELRVSCAGAARGGTVGELIGPDSGTVIVLAIRRADGRTMFNPGQQAAIVRDDVLILMGEPASLRKIEARVAG